MNRVTSSRLLLAVTALLFSTGGAAIKAVGLSSWQVACFRSAIAVVAIWLLVPASHRGWSWRVIPAGMTYGCTFVLFVASTKLTTSANAIFLQDTAPVYVLLLAPLLLKEGIKRADLIFGAVVGLGFSMFFLGHQTAMATAPDPIAGNLLAALSAVTWALAIICLRWLSRHGGGEGALASVVAGNLMASIALLPVALPVHGARPVDWAVLVYLGVFQIGLAYFLLSRAVRHVPAFEATTLLLLEPVFNPIWAWLIHGERPAPAALAGGAVILGATFVHTWLESRARSASASSSETTVSA